MKFAAAGIAAATGRMMLIDTDRVPQASYAARRPSRSIPTRWWPGRSAGWRNPCRKGSASASLPRHLAVSERTLNRRFKLAVGEAPLHYLQSLRVDVAKRLLETRALNVRAVGERVGYGDLSTFRRLSKRETGLSPREYQRRFSRRHQGRSASAQPAPRLSR